MNTLPVRKDQASEREVFRDELNFAEFPLASVSTSLPKDQKTLEFTDEIFDQSRNQRVIRKLTITASDKYGLPTAMDDEVILGLIQLSGKKDFSERRVFFTRYELLKLLNWTDDTRNYNRLEQSLNRWLGVTLYYDKAWWSKEEQSWVNEGFHILDHVQIFDQERRRRATQRGGKQSGKSSFVWNEVVFNSFKAGYLKQIDFEFYKALESAVSKRMYRFLDKRFYRSQKVEFDLRTFACEHVGLSKRYHNGELKRVLSPALSELEQRGFLRRLSPDERFIRKMKGEWTIVLIRECKQITQSSEPTGLSKALIERGISRGSAEMLVNSVAEEKIQEKLRFFEWLRKKNDPRIRKNPAGFLYKSIAEDFALPDDYLRETTKRATVIPIRKLAPVKASLLSTDRKVIDNYWASVPADEREAIERQLVTTASKFLREQYVAGQKERGVLFQTVRQAMIDQYVRAQLQKANRALLGMPV